MSGQEEPMCHQELFPEGYSCLQHLANPSQMEDGVFKAVGEPWIGQVA